MTENFISQKLKHVFSIAEARFLLLGGFITSLLSLPPPELEENISDQTGSEKGPTERTVSQTLNLPPTCAELLRRVEDPNHPSQTMFYEHGPDGRMLPSCVLNGYTYIGYNPWIRPPIACQLRAEAQMKDLNRK